MKTKISCQNLFFTISGAVLVLYCALYTLLRAVDFFSEIISFLTGRGGDYYYFIQFSNILSSSVNVLAYKLAPIIFLFVLGVLLIILRNKWLTALIASVLSGIYFYFFFIDTASVLSCLIQPLARLFGLGGDLLWPSLLNALFELWSSIRYFLPFVSLLTLAIISFNLYKDPESKSRYLWFVPMALWAVTSVFNLLTYILEGIYYIETHGYGITAYDSPLILIVTFILDLVLLAAIALYSIGLFSPSDESDVTVKIKINHERIVDQMKKYKDLFDADVITEDEFIENKNQILSPLTACTDTAVKARATREQIVGYLGKYKGLLDSGAITEEEFSVIKDRIFSLVIKD